MNSLNDLPVSFDSFGNLTVAKKDLKILAKDWINDLEKLVEEHSEMVVINDDHKIDKEDFGMFLFTKFFNISGEEI